MDGKNCTGHGIKGCSRSICRSLCTSFYDREGNRDGTLLRGTMQTQLVAFRVPRFIHSRLADFSQPNPFLCETVRNLVIDLDVTKSCFLLHISGQVPICLGKSISPCCTQTLATMACSTISYDCISSKFAPIKDSKRNQQFAAFRRSLCLVGTWLIKFDHSNPFRKHCDFEWQWIQLCHWC